MRRITSPKSTVASAAGRWMPNLLIPFKSLYAFAHDIRALDGTHPAHVHRGVISSGHCTENLEIFFKFTCV